MMLTTRRGVKLFYEVGGPVAAPPLLLVRGLARSSRYWLGLRDGLERDFRLIIMDNRGVGRSDAPWPPYSTAAMADDAVAVLDAAGMQRVHVFGISLGGMIAMQLALRAPERVDRLVLGCTTAGGRKAHRIPLPVIGALARGAGQPFDQALASTARFVLAESFLARRPDILDRWREIARSEPARRRGLIGQITAGALHNVWRELPRLGARTLVVTGDADRMIPPANSRLIADRIPGAQLRILPGAGHDFPTELPEETLALLGDFLLRS